MLQKSTREIILETAIRLYGRHGYDNVPLRELAFESSVPEDEIRSLFPTKESIFDGIIAYIPTILEHYDPSREDLEHLLQTETPAQILSRFVTYYDLQNEELWKSVYRFIFMEQYRSEALAHMAYTQVFGPPRTNAARAIDQLVEMGVIPPL